MLYLECPSCRSEVKATCSECPECFYQFTLPDYPEGPVDLIEEDYLAVDELIAGNGLDYYLPSRSS